VTSESATHLVVELYVIFMGDTDEDGALIRGELPVAPLVFFLGGQQRRNGDLFVGYAVIVGIGPCDDMKSSFGPDDGMLDRDGQGS